jgi:hypothetical protein
MRAEHPEARALQLALRPVEIAGASVVEAIRLGAREFTEIQGVVGQNARLLLDDAMRAGDIAMVWDGTPRPVYRETRETVVSIVPAGGDEDERLFEL